MPRQIEKKTGRLQLIETVLKDGTQCLLPPHVLDIMLARDRVCQFRRASGWVAVGIVPIRAGKRGEGIGTYQGPERRTAACH